MVTNRYDFAAFVGRVKDKHPLEILQHADAEITRVERESFGTKGGVKARSEGSVTYIGSLKALMNYLQNAGLTRPGTLSDTDFQTLRPLCEAQVKSGMFTEGALSLFS